MNDTPFVIQVITDLANVTNQVNSHFNDEKKTTQWLNSVNSLLKNKTPTELIFEGRIEELKIFIENQFNE